MSCGDVLEIEVIEGFGADSAAPNTETPLALNDTVDPFTDIAIMAPGTGALSE